MLLIATMFFISCQEEDQVVPKDSNPIANRGPGETTCLYSAGGYSIGLSNSKMTYRGIRIMNGLTEQSFALSSPIVLAESGVVDDDGPQDATDHMSNSWNSIYSTTNSPRFCLDVDSSIDGNFYLYSGALLVSNIPGDYITRVHIRYEFGGFYYDQYWDPYEVEVCDPLEECDGYSPGFTHGGGG